MPNGPTLRRYEMDWLRTIAIFILLLYHVGMIFVPWGFHIKNAETTHFLEPIMIFLHKWRMPMLFFIAGAGTVFALKRRTIRQFVVERHNRLMIPVVLGMFVIVPPQIYYERYEQFSSFWQFYPKVFEFVPYPNGSFSWHHLWFIVYLFVYSVITIPALPVLKKGKGLWLMGKLEMLLQKKGGFLWMLIPLIVSQALLRPFYPREAHNLLGDWAFFVFYYFFFLAGLFVCHSSVLWHKLKDHRHVHLMVGIGSIALMLFMYATWEGEVLYRRIIWEVNGLVMAWTSVLAVLGYGQAHLNFNKPILKPLNEAAYPFYILHQTAIIVIGFYVIQWELSIFWKFIVIASASFVASASTYWFLIRPFNWMRFIFGMKPNYKQTVAQSSMVPLAEKP